jgi:hypothetical protein
MDAVKSTPALMFSARIMTIEIAVGCGYGSLFLLANERSVLNLPRTLGCA